ncbi:CcmD family protein [Fodinibius sp. AD559]|uniref:CcmD family protein n=1 Tax=Fodinibius sp. AD559 TaxID=3424179 RepID=UPI004046DD53
MNFLPTQAQEDTVAAVDTLTESYSQKWDGTSGLDEASPLIQTVASYDLIFIVLGVSLIIWFVLLFFIIRVDKKVSKLEEEIEKSNVEGTS